MSLAALALRSCVLLSLWKQTLADDRVHDSSLAPLDELVEDIPLPFITISIDEAINEPSPGFSLTQLRSIERLSLVIEMGVGQAVKIQGENGEEERVVAIPFTDFGLETALDFITNQVTAILSGSSGWADLFRRFSFGPPRRVIRLRGGESKGSRYAARQLIIELEPIADPEMGYLPEDGPWADFLAALRALNPSADPEMQAYVDLADALEAALKSPGGFPDWRKALALMGLPLSAAASLGFDDLGGLMDQATILEEGADPLVIQSEPGA